MVITSCPASLDYCPACLGFIVRFASDSAIEGWLAERKWKPADLKSKLTKRVNIEFCIRFCDENGEPAGHWEAVYSPSKNHCTKEKIDLLDFVLQTTSGEIEAFCVQESPPKGWKDWKA